MPQRTAMPKTQIEAISGCRTPRYPDYPEVSMKTNAIRRPARSRGARRIVAISCAMAAMFVSLVIPGRSWAIVSWSEITKQEVRILPTYCQENRFLIQQTPEIARKWHAYLGEPADHIHHWCWALVEISRSYKFGLADEQRKGYLETAISNIRYVVQRSDDSFVLRGEMLTAYADCHLRLGKIADAEKIFEEARRVAPKYWRSYLLWALHLRQTGKTREALSLVEAGLAESPGAKALLSLRDELQSGGKPQAQSQDQATKKK